MAFLADNLGREVIGRAAEGVRLVGELHRVLCQTEVGDAHVTLEVQKDVLRLQITVNDLERVEVVQRRGDLCRV